MTRRLKTAVEIVSDIGSKAFDLQYHSERDIIEAVVVLRQSWALASIETVRVAIRE